MATCNCEAGYGKNHSILCDFVREDHNDEDDNDALLDYPRAAIPEAIELGIE